MGDDVAVAESASTRGGACPSDAMADWRLGHSAFGRGTFTMSLSGQGGARASGVADASAQHYGSLWARRPDGACDATAASDAAL